MKFLFLTIFLLFSLTSCKFRIDKSGYIFENIDINFIQKDITSKNSLLKNMGSPSIVTWIEDDEYWIYYSEEVKHILFMKPSIINRDIILLKFKDDRVNYFKKLDLNDEDSKFFSNLNKTYVKGHKSNFFKEFFSNVGTVRP
jgi:outer membrane protein assembly factor BamE (lipoprotein component of BamABCDE complex)